MLTSPNDNPTLNLHFTPEFDHSFFPSSFHRMTIDPHSRYAVESKHPLHGIPNTTRSFRQMHINDIIRDVKKWMSFVPYKTVEPTFRDSFMAGLTLPPYELPDGTMICNR